MDHTGTKGYFTVEAALVIPLMLGVILLLMHMMLFQYNRCLLEQDIGILAFRGTVLTAEHNSDLAAKLQEQAERLYLDKYIGFIRKDIRIKVGQGSISVSTEGKQEAFSNNMIPGIAGAEWKTEVSYQNKQLSPTIFVRVCRRIKNGLTVESDLNISSGGS